MIIGSQGKIEVIIDVFVDLNEKEDKLETILVIEPTDIFEKKYPLVMAACVIDTKFNEPQRCML